MASEGYVSDLYLEQVMSMFENVISVFSAETLSSDKMSIDIGHTLITLFCQENVRIPI